MAQMTVPNDLRVSGTITCTNFAPPAACITNTAIQAAAGIEATKVIHQFPVRYQTADGSAVAAATVPIHVAYKAGTIVAVEAMCIDAPTSSDTVAVDIQKGNQSTGYATILSGTIDFDNSSANREVIAGTLSTSSYADGDSFQAVVTVSGSTAQGLCVILWLRETPA